MAAGHGVDPGRRLGLLDDVTGLVAPRFRRVEPRRRARALVLGLVAGLPGKNCWTIAGHAEDESPHGMRHLLAGAKRDAGGVRDDVRGYVTGQPGDPGAVLAADETGDLKKGTATAGVQRQYTGTAGRIENSQVAVCLGYAAPGGHALIDRELYLPRSWTSDPERCQAAGIAEETAFATKPQPAQRMTERAVTAGVPFAWITGDEANGDNGPLRAWLDQQNLPYVLAVACDHQIPAGAGRPPQRSWQQMPAGTGAKGHRRHDWARITIKAPGPGCHYLLIRRNRSTRELAFHRCCSPRPVTLAVLVKTAGLHWTIKENSQSGTGLTGLDQHQARRWTSWYR